MSSRVKEPATPDTLDAPVTLRAIGDGELLQRMLDASATSVTLAAELERRLADDYRRPTLRRLLEQYATAAPEYVDEDLQAVARVYLGRYFRAT